MSCRNALEGPTPALPSIINRGASSTSLVLTELNSEDTSHLPKGCSMVDRNPLFARLPGTLSDRWWFTLPALTLLLLTPTLHHGQPFLTWDTAQYYHYGAQLVGFATA